MIRILFFASLILCISCEDKPQTPEDNKFNQKLASPPTAPSVDYSKETVSEFIKTLSKEHLIELIGTLSRERLIELVKTLPKEKVIGIVDTLATNAAKAKSAQVCMNKLVQASDAFFEEYQWLPAANGKTIDTTVTTVGKQGSPVMAALLALQSAQAENPKRLVFFHSQIAKDRKDGLQRTEKTADLFDPWSNPYHILMNYDYDNKLQEPVTGSTVFDRRSIVWSAGPDGKFGTPKTNVDNLHSWRVEPMTENEKRELNKWLKSANWTKKRKSGSE